ncbi:MAG TPA: hypothetical protein VMD27_05280 [Candidatus Aquilonibacter sp.]|nr:hypothetical protein [Candidatus Aquilonibacter sp.]
MEVNSFDNFQTHKQLFTDAILKAAAGLLFPSGTDIPESCITLGGNSSQARVRIWKELKECGYVPNEIDSGTFRDFSNVERIDLIIKTATRVANGLRRFLSDQTDIDEYPAWELHCVYDRNPPENNWPNFWRAAAKAAHDDGALRVLEKYRRMVALKSSSIWQALGNGEGGNDKALGNKWPPFAVDSGFDVDGVPYNECVRDLNLLNADGRVEPAVIPSPENIAQKFTEIFSQYLMRLDEN